MKITVAIAAVSMLAATSAPALAMSEDEFGPSARVSYADLDLTRPEGREVLNQRIDGAIRLVCPAPDVRVLVDTAAHAACVRVARSSADSQVARTLAGRGRQNGDVSVTGR